MSSLELVGSLISNVIFLHSYIGSLTIPKSQIPKASSAWCFKELISITIITSSRKLPSRDICFQSGFDKMFFLAFCDYWRFGTGGHQENVNAICILALNIINDKVSWSRVDHKSWFMFWVLLFHHGVIHPGHIPQHFYHHGQDHYEYHHHDNYDHHHHYHHHDYYDHKDDYQVFLVLWWWMGMLLFLATIRLFYRAIQCKYDENICWKRMICFLSPTVGM